MRIYHFSILFMLLSFSVIVTLGVRLGEDEDHIRHRNQMELKLDDAASCAVRQITDLSGSEYERECAVNMFFLSLYSELGILDKEEAKQEIEGRIPVLLFSEGDRAFAYAFCDVKSGESLHRKRVWYELERKDTQEWLKGEISEYLKSEGNCNSEIGVYIPVESDSDIFRQNDGISMMAVYVAATTTYEEGPRIILSGTQYKNRFRTLHKNTDNTEAYPCGDCFGEY